MKILFIEENMEILASIFSNKLVKLKKEIIDRDEVIIFDLYKSFTQGIFFSLVLIGTFFYSIINIKEYAALAVISYIIYIFMLIGLYPFVTRKMIVSNKSVYLIIVNEVIKIPLGDIYELNLERKYKAYFNYYFSFCSPKGKFELNGLSYKPVFNFECFIYLLNKMKNENKNEEEFIEKYAIFVNKRNMRNMEDFIDYVNAKVRCIKTVEDERVVDFLKNILKELETEDYKKWNKLMEKIKRKNLVD